MGKAVEKARTRMTGISLQKVAISAATGVGLALLVLAWGHWWPSGNSWYLTAALGVLLVVAAGVVWMFGSIIVLSRRRQIVWWMLAWPLVTVLGVTFAFLVRPEFEDARPEFEEVAEQLLATPGPTAMYDLKIGRFDILRADDAPDGTVYFADRRETMFNTEQGWLYSPGGMPTARGDRLTIEHLGGPWHRYKMASP
ncbi:hypothetical protein ONR57_12340 [Hoyosella sp. YIM 151337]|uniref:hypothetical protein n=1 Tax=Hoyosella sp. YIM 151337 TaxID=2992742 RepID=UPI0022369AFE|nr:hypothetical protein [Hoyosella sp. YIM 151337]MCW4354089.1 hypothetical protein [Hoyosella sp. YIM 151337]